MEACPKCKRSDKVEKFYTIEPMYEWEVKSYVCTRCMEVVSTEGFDIEAVIAQVKQEINYGL